MSMLASFFLMGGRDAGSSAVVEKQRKKRGIMAANCVFIK